MHPSGQFQRSCKYVCSVCIYIYYTYLCVCNYIHSSIQPTIHPNRLCLKLGHAGILNSWLSNGFWQKSNQPDIQPVQLVQSPLTSEGGEEQKLRIRKELFATYISGMLGWFIMFIIGTMLPDVGITIFIPDGVYPIQAAHPQAAGSVWAARRGIAPRWPVFFLVGLVSGKPSHNAF